MLKPIYLQSVNSQHFQVGNELKWVETIKYALSEDLFLLYAQPITNLQENRPQQHFEILLRLLDCDGKVISPGLFMETAENYDLMPDIDTWVINNLFEQLAANKNKDWRNYKFSINLSGASLNCHTFRNFLTNKIASSSLPPQLFCFEITEAIAILDLALIQKFIINLRNMGCSFALDDFGKGMSSLTYLKNLSVNYLKIDGSFVRQLDCDRISRVMVEAFQHMATGMGLKTIAEYVKNQDIQIVLQDLKIDYGQGYHLGYPQEFGIAV